jgi:hypothetical protein
MQDIATLPNVAGELSRLVNRAPAGGVFTNVDVYALSTIHEGFANEQRRFIVRTQGHQFEVTVERLHSR